jgi:hypothetical protein
MPKIDHYVGQLFGAAQIGRPRRPPIVVEVHCFPAAFLRKELSVFSFQLSVISNTSPPIAMGGPRLTLPSGERPSLDSIARWL